jgi:hypothetical protein
MAEAADEHTSKFVVPPPPSLSIPDAIALVSPPLDAEKVKQALANGLINGAIRSTDAAPQLFWAAYDFRSLVLQGVPPADLDAIAALAQGRLIPPTSWHMWLSIPGVVHFESGQVIRLWEGRHPPLCVFKPLLDRTDVERYFAAPAPETAIDQSEEAGTAAEPVDDQPEVELKDAPEGRIRVTLRSVYASHPEGEGPSLANIIKPVQQQLETQGWRASKMRIQEIAGEKEFENRRRKVGQHR